jgi:hypothetical protein
VHLCVQFSLFFREEFIRLKVLLFEKLLLNATSNYTKIAVLFMTADTANQTIISQLEPITGYTSFQKRNIFWPTGNDAASYVEFWEDCVAGQATGLQHCCR